MVLGWGGGLINTGPRIHSGHFVGLHALTLVVFVVAVEGIGVGVIPLIALGLVECPNLHRHGYLHLLVVAVDQGRTRFL